MIIKWVGIGLVMAASVSWGLMMSLRERFRIDDLTELKAAFLLLKAEIDFGLCQLSEAMENVGTKTGEPVNGIFIRFAQGIKDTKENAEAVWRCSVDTSDNIGLSDDDRDMLKTFGRSLGYLDKNMQLNNINTQINYISDKLAILNEKAAKSIKLYNSIGILGGLMIVIILI